MTVPFPVGTAADGGTLMSAGAPFPGSLPLGPETLTEAGSGFSLANPYLLGSILAGSFLLPKAAKFFDSNKFTTETDRLKALADKGVKVPEQLGATLPQGKGRSTDELVAIENAKAQQGMYSNPTFAKSRNVADLKAEDIWGYSAFLEKFGDDWLNKFTEQQRRDIAQAALSSNAVTEHHGTIDVDFSKIKDLDNLISGKSSLNTPAQPGVNVQPGQNNSALSQQGANDAQLQNTINAINAAQKNAAAQAQAIQDRGAKLNMAMKSQDIARNMLAQNQAWLGTAKYPTPPAPVDTSTFARITNDSSAARPKPTNMVTQPAGVKPPVASVPQEDFESTLNRLLGGL